MAFRRTRILSTLIRHWTTSTAFQSTQKSSHFSRVRNWPFSTSVLHEAELSSSIRYTIRIITGSVRGAGTSANVRLRLIGAEAESPSFLLMKDRGFGQGSVETELVHVDRPLGALRMVHVQREELSTRQEEGNSWFLEKLLIEDSNGAQHCFPCMQWFGTSECGSIKAPLERYLLPASLHVGEMLKKKQRKVDIKASGMVIPHPQKVQQGMKAQSRNGRGLGGEDAYFYAFGKNGVFGMGVADGVYAWREKGIDSGRFAFFLMDQAYINVKMGYDDVFQVLRTASRKVETEGVYGSSTCCLLTINMNQGRLNSANLGDSGFIVIGCRDFGSDYHLVFRTPQQEHEFGRPYQLGHHQYSSPPHEAMLYNFQICSGDTIIMGTDGLFDNVFLPKIIEQVKVFRTAGNLSPQHLAGKLISMAHEASIDKKVETPYSRGFTEAFNLSSTGGKPDDITVIVAYVL